MKRKEQTIVEKEIPGREHAGYAYIYPLDGGARQEYVLEMTPENIANFIGAHQYDAEKVSRAAFEAYAPQKDKPGAQ